MKNKDLFRVNFVTKKSGLDRSSGIATVYYSI